MDEQVVSMGWENLGICYEPVTSRWLSWLHLETRSSSPPLVTPWQWCRSSCVNAGHLLARMASPLSVSRPDPARLIVLNAANPEFLLMTSRMDLIALSVSISGLFIVRHVHNSGSQDRKYRRLQVLDILTMSTEDKKDRMAIIRSSESLSKWHRLFLCLSPLGVMLLPWGIFR